MSKTTAYLLTGDDIGIFRKGCQGAAGRAGSLLLHGRVVGRREVDPLLLQAENWFQLKSVSNKKNYDFIEEMLVLKFSNTSK